MNINKNVTKVVINNSKKIAVNLGKLTATAVAVAYVTPRDSRINSTTNKIN